MASTTSRAHTAGAGAGAVPHAPAARPRPLADVAPPGGAAGTADSTSTNPRSSTGGGGDSSSSSSKRKADAAAASFVFLRIKRRRNEDPVERLVLQQQLQAAEEEGAAADVVADSTQDAGEADARDGSDSASKSRKRSATSASARSSSSLLGAFAKLSTQEQSFVFTRIDTLEQHQLADAGAAKWTERLKRKVKALKDEPRAPLRKSSAAAAAAAPTRASAPASQLRAQQQQDRLRERRKSDAQRSRGLSGAAPPAGATPPAPAIEIKQQQTLELPGVRVVDLETVVRQPPGSTDYEASGSTPSITLNGARLRPTRVLNPSEREVDEAIWYAFRENDFSRFFRIFHSQTLESKLSPAAFQRPADGATVLMAAALHGRADVIEVMLRSSSASALQQDWEGATAATFAARAGFKNVEAALLACEAAEREKDFVYDVYCVDVSASKEHASVAGGADAGAVAGEESTPVVAVSAAVQRWLSQDANWKGEDERVEEYMLESDAEDDSDDDSVSVDSNDENHADNDYPDEEDSDDGSDYDSDDSEQSSEHHRRRWRQRAPSDEGATNDDALDD